MKKSPRNTVLSSLADQMYLFASDATKVSVSHSTLIFLKLLPAPAANFKTRHSGSFLDVEAYSALCSCTGVCWSLSQF